MDANLHVEKQQVLVRKLVSERIDLKKVSNAAARCPCRHQPDQDKARKWMRISRMNTNPNPKTNAAALWARHSWRTMEELMLIVVEGADGPAVPRKLRGWWTAWKPGGHARCKSG